MKTRIMMFALALFATTATMGAEMKVPIGCVAAANAKAAADGYANRIIHEKTGIELVLIPAGSFSMGAKMGRSQPLHKVTIAEAFYIGKTEVTNAQYRKLIEASGYDGKGDTDPAYDLYLRHWRGKSLMSKDDDYPVVWVSWKNAKRFCDWAGLALPSEAQWEYACRAGTTTLFYNGDDQRAFDEIGWELNNSGTRTHPVARKKPNAWNLYDMLGNVWEWAEDDYVSNYEGAPDDGAARVENPRTITRALRGGSLNSNGARPSVVVVLSSAARFNSAPSNAANDVGFRVVLPIR